MNFLKRLFGKQTSPGNEPPSHLGAGASIEPEIHMQKEGGPPLRIKPSSISHAYIALTHADFKHAGNLQDKVVELNRHTQPKLWNRNIVAKKSVISTEKGGGGFPDPNSICYGLEAIGLEQPYTLVAWDMVVSFDGGATNTKLMVGFAYSDQTPKIVLARKYGCVAA